MLFVVLVEVDYNWVSGGWGGVFDCFSYYYLDSEVCIVDNDWLYISVLDYLCILFCVGYVSFSFDLFFISLFMLYVNVDWYCLFVLYMYDILYV